MLKPTEGRWFVRNTGGRGLHTNNVWAEIPLPDPTRNPRLVKIATVENPFNGDAELLAASKELLRCCRGAYHALRSYQNGNASPQLAEEIADALKVTLEGLLEGETPE